MSSDARVTYWLKGQPVQNFGDALSEILFDALTQRSPWRWQQGRMRGEFDVVHLIGSVISDFHIVRDLEYVRASGGQRIAFWGCGLRSNAPPPAALAARCAFLGVRGPLTRDVLGLPPSTALGDPGLLMPHIYQPRTHPKFQGKTVCVPHFLDKKSDEELLALSGCQAVLRPNIASGAASVLAFIDCLSSAQFVLAGALHAAIVACAYDIPFAYFDSGYIDVPFKWADFAASVNMRCEFVQTIEEGVRLFALQSKHAQAPPLLELIACAPYRAPATLFKKIQHARRGPSLGQANGHAAAAEVGELVSAAGDGADFTFLPVSDAGGINASVRRVTHCSVIFDEQGHKILRLRGGGADAGSNGMTGGYAIRVPPSVTGAAGNRNIRISVVARAERGVPETRFAVAYSTNEAGNSGWRWFEATAKWSVFDLPYSVPQATGKHGAYIGLLPAIDAKPGIEVRMVAVRVL